MASILNRRVLCLFSFIILLEIPWSLSFHFDNDHFGVSFTPYVKHLTNEETSYYKTGYTFENIQTMLTVASTKFSKILVKDCLAIHDNYRHNYTYYNGSRPSVFSGEAAAIINRKNGTKILTVVYLICEPKYVNNTETEVSLAFEAAEKANKIFPGTVEAIAFWKGDGQADLDLTLKYLQSYQEKASQLELKLGAEQDCFASLDNETNPLVNTRREILYDSEFILCGTFRDQRTVSPEVAFNSTKADLMLFKRSLQTVNPNVEVYGFTVWFNLGSDDNIEELDNLRIYWETTSAWAAMNNYTVYMWEAFDNPWQPHPFFNGHVGWWKLEDNSQINFVDGYTEKVSVLQEGHFSKIRSHSKRTPITNSTTAAKVEQQGNHATTMSSTNGVIHPYTNEMPLIAFLTTIWSCYFY